MKRFHVLVAVSDLDAGIRFCSAVFGSEPTVGKNDYAEWMLDEPHLNFAISQRGGKPGVNISASRSTATRSSKRCTPSSKPPIARSRPRRAPTAATRARTSTGLPIRPAYVGNRSTRLAAFRRTTSQTIPRRRNRHAARRKRHTPPRSQSRPHAAAADVSRRRVIGINSSRRPGAVTWATMPSSAPLPPPTR